MVSNITLGQYVPGKSFLHRMDARVKIVLIIAFIVLVFVGQNYPALGIVVVSVLGVMAFSNVPVKLYFKSLRMIIFVVILTAGLNLFYGRGEPLWQFGFMTITEAGITNAVFIALRIISLIFISSVLTFTTSPTDLTDALERLMKPLKVLHISVHEIAMMMTIALRFVPTLLEETDKIMSAQKARGADLESGGLFQRIKALVPILIPLFVSSFRRAEERAMAMECRCYQGGSGRTRMKSMHMTRLDGYAIVGMCVILAGVVLCNVFLPAAVR